MSDYAHKSVLVDEVLVALKPKAGGIYADGTLGGAGHAEAILAASSPNGWLYGCDRDGVAVEAGLTRLARFEGRFEIRRWNFAELDQWLEPGCCDGVLLDLGVSSPQLDEGQRGFSFQQDGPLDMRMDDRQPLTAGDLLNSAGADELARIFWEWGGEREARRFARAVVQRRESVLFTRTLDLAELIEKLSPRRGRKAHPATRVFQALRMAVNDEVGCLRRGLASAFKVLKPGGRLAVITFHSMEDRMVKEFGRELAREYTFPGDVDVPELRQPRVPELRLISRKAILPGAEELRSNPRSRSAQLRVMERMK